MVAQAKQLSEAVAARSTPAASKLGETPLYVVLLMLVYN